MGNGRAPLTTLGQELHYLPVGALLPRVHLHLPPGMVKRALGIAPSLVGLRQAVQGLDDLAAELLPGEQCPFFEIRAVREREALQEGGAIEADSFFQRVHEILVGGWLVRSWSYRGLG